MTGILYGFYTTKPIELVFELLKAEAQNINYHFEYNHFQDEKSLLFYKSQEMLDYHLNNGYNLDLEGEGCFCVEAKRVNLHGIASLFEFEGKSDFEPYDINLSFDNIFYYVLVVPDIIENSDFCLKIHDMIKRVLALN
ncbi:hypothetical protein [Xylocopilactobacillus apis]|uniref:CDI immunity protein domain-containing protein n=1 Tax=Xylocopilactobacillus apis TaxID=2932183 RepID=A0AAU9D7R5_9LACO|nr:hypothetical protein [Xylocopilactobacillus apis]BDR55710.1 hypothetical protein KIMC2_02720 [Xylocopilactobacillus apis]